MATLHKMGKIFLIERCETEKQLIRMGLIDLNEEHRQRIFRQYEAKVKKKETVCK